MKNSYSYRETSKELIQYFTKLSDLLKYAEMHDLPELSLGTKKVSVLDLKKSLFDLLHHVKLEMFNYHKEKDTPYGMQEISYLEGLAKYDQYTALQQEYILSRYSSGILQFFAAIATLLKFSKEGNFVSDASLFGVGRLMDITSTPFDKLKADLDMLHTAESYADYLKETRILKEAETTLNAFEKELSNAYLIQNVENYNEVEATYS